MGAHFSFPDRLRVVLFCFLSAFFDADSFTAFTYAAFAAKRADRQAYRLAISDKKAVQFSYVSFRHDFKKFFFGCM